MNTSFPLIFPSCRHFGRMIVLFLALEASGADNADPQSLYGPPTTGAAYRSWKNVRIDGGGFVSGLIASTVPGGPFYARTDVGGAYRWEGATKSWLPISDNLAGSREIESLAADPVNPGIAYMASGGAIHRSANQGGSWISVKIPAWMSGNGEGRSAGERLAIDPHRPATLFYGSRRDGLWRSDDAGAAWSKVAGFTDWKKDIGITFVLVDRRSGGPGRASQTLYAGVCGNTANLYRSTDGGASWTAVSGQPTGMFPNHAAQSSAGLLYLSYANSGGPNGMTDGAVWRYDPAAPAATAWKEISPVDPGKGSGDFFGYGSIALDPRDPNTLVVASMDRWNWGDTMWRTTNANAEAPAWTVLFSHKIKPKWESPVGYKVRDTHWIGDIEFNPAHPGQLFFTFGLGVQRTDNVDAGAEAVWTFSAQGLEETVALCLASPAAGPPLVSGLGDIGGFVHVDLDRSPAVQLPSGNTSGLDVAALAPAIMARVGSDPGKFSTDGGATWMPFPSLSPGKGGEIAISADGRIFLWTTGGVTHRSPDRGANWTPVPALPDHVQVFADRINPNKFYGYQTTTGTLFFSVDGGATFTKSDAKLPGTYTYLRARIRAVPGFEGHLYATSQNWRGFSSLYKSTDSGKTFVPVSGMDGNGKHLTGNTAVRAISSFGFGKGAPGRRYPALYLSGTLNQETGETKGIFRSDDGGTSWIRINDDNHRFNANVIIGDSRAPLRVYLGTDGRGVIYGEP
jgi:photosystem II stability/assembly factor-like uncharacterized protein